MFIISFAFAWNNVQSQVLFSTNDLPCSPGQYSTAYYSTNVDVSNYIHLNTNGLPDPGTGTNVAQLWNFSQPQQSNEAILQTDIIAAEVGGYSDYFPSATYAEQDTFESNGIIGWRYYAFAGPSTNAGRLYYGFDVPVDGASPEAVFNPPSVDIPASVQLGQSWTRSFSWPTLYYGSILASNHFTAYATADAFGTILLPQIGEVPALRLHEIHSYVVTEVSNPPLLLDMHTNQYYYWLVPGLGVAAQVFLLGNNILYPTNMPYTNGVQRMYFANYFTNSSGVGTQPIIPSFPTNLRIALRGDSAVLNWDAFTNSTSYRVDFTQSLPATNWQALGFTPGLIWTDSITCIQGFYRVVGTP